MNSNGSLLESNRTTNKPNLAQTRTITTIKNVRCGIFNINVLYEYKLVKLKTDNSCCPRIGPGYIKDSYKPTFSVETSFQPSNKQHFDQYNQEHMSKSVSTCGPESIEHISFL